MESVFIAVNLCILLAILCPQASGAASNTVQRTSSAGKLTGIKATVLKKKLEIYQSIPYAEPPVGVNRFKRPILKKSWTGVLDATKLPSTCIQNGGKTSNSSGSTGSGSTGSGSTGSGGSTVFAGVAMSTPTTTMSEDCLFLNVWTPVSSGSKSTKAVMIFIHGGAFIAGATSVPLYDGSVIAAAGDVVVVTVQYRLSLLGFYYLGTSDAPGNVGLIDQSTAIQWVANNIASFGGDPKRITVFGESAGSISTSFHLFSEVSRDLFQYAIMESGACLHTNNYKDPDDVKSYSLKFADLMGCNSTKPAADVVACLQKIDPVLLTAKMYSVNPGNAGVNRFNPTIDGYFLTSAPLDYVAKSSYKKTNILAGVNEDEGTYLVMFPKSQVPSVFDFEVIDPITWDQFNQTVETVLASEPQAVRNSVKFLYGTSGGFSSTPADTVSLFNAYSIVGDRLIACSTVALIEAYASWDQNVYAYLFDHKSNANPWPEWMGAMHTGELEYVFGFPLIDTTGAYTQGEKYLSQRIIQHWSNFAKTGNPNTKESGSRSFPYYWPVYTHDEKKYQLLEVGPAGVDRGLLYQRCQFWNTLIPQLKASLATASRR